MGHWEGEKFFLEVALVVLVLTLMMFVMVIAAIAGGRRCDVGVLCLLL